MAQVSTYSECGETSFYERVPYLFHRLGAQSNILVAARYTNRNGEKLTKEAINSALRRVVEAHGKLRAVGVRRPSAKKGHHSLHHAVLNAIDVASCVEYIDDAGGNGVNPEFMERVHNEWLYTEDEPSKPWWKVIVVGMRELVFVTHHFVSDGIGCMTFHREFLNALNTADSSEHRQSSTVVYTGSGELEFQDALTLNDTKAPGIIPGMLLLFQLWILHYLGSIVVFGELTRSRRPEHSATAVAKPSQRLVTRVSSIRIQASIMAQCVAACRAHKTTFTALLLVLVKMTLANDIYPHARLVCGRYPVNARPYMDMARLKAKTDCGSMINASCAGGRVSWLGRLRKAERYLEGNQNQGMTVDTKAVWDLVLEEKQVMSQTSSRNIGFWQSSRQVGPSLENLVGGGFWALALMCPFSFLLSNLGAFDGRPANVTEEEMRSRAWTIDDMQFSAGSTNGYLGSQGLIFSIVGVKDGDTVINAEYEDGIVSRQTAETVLAGVMSRLEAVI